MNWRAEAAAKSFRAVAPQACQRVRIFFARRNAERDLVEDQEVGEALVWAGRQGAQGLCGVLHRLRRKACVRRVAVITNV